MTQDRSGVAMDENPYRSPDAGPTEPENEQVAWRASLGHAAIFGFLASLCFLVVWLCYLAHVPLEIPALLDRLCQTVGRQAGGMLIVFVPTFLVGLAAATWYMRVSERRRTIASLILVLCAFGSILLIFMIRSLAAR